MFVLIMTGVFVLLMIGTRVFADTDLGVACGFLSAVVILLVIFGGMAATAPPYGYYDDD